MRTEYLFINIHETYPRGTNYPRMAPTFYTELLLCFRHLNVTKVYLLHDLAEVCATIKQYCFVWYIDRLVICCTLSDYNIYIRLQTTLNVRKTIYATLTAIIRSTVCTQRRTKITFLHQ